MGVQNKLKKDSFELYFGLGDMDDKLEFVNKEQSKSNLGWVRFRSER